MSLLTHMERWKDKSKKVLCVETGKVYESIREAERLTGVSHSNISKCCIGKLKSAGGFHWQYID